MSQAMTDATLYHKRDGTKYGRLKMEFYWHLPSNLPLNVAHAECF